MPLIIGAAVVLIGVVAALVAVLRGKGGADGSGTDRGTLAVVSDPVPPLPPAPRPAPAALPKKSIPAAAPLAGKLDLWTRG